MSEEAAPGDPRPAAWGCAEASRRPRAVGRALRAQGGPRTGTGWGSPFGAGAGAVPARGALPGDEAGRGRLGGREEGPVLAAWAALPGRGGGDGGGRGGCAPQPRRAALLYELAPYIWK